MDLPLDAAEVCRIPAELFEECIQHGNFGAKGHQPVHEVAADKSQTAGDQHRTPGKGARETIFIAHVGCQNHVWASFRPMARMELPHGYRTPWLSSQFSRHITL